MNDSRLTIRTVAVAIMPYITFTSGGDTAAVLHPHQTVSCAAAVSCIYLKSIAFLPTVTWVETSGTLAGAW